MKRRLTDLRGLRVVTSEGAQLGHISEVQCESGSLASQKDCRVVAFCLGSLGLLERLGFKPKKLKQIPWASVCSIDDQQLVVNHQPR